MIEELIVTGVVCAVVPIVVALAKRKPEPNIYDSLAEIQANYDKYKAKIKTIERMLEVNQERNKEAKG